MVSSDWLLNGRKRCYKTEWSLGVCDCGVSVAVTYILLKAGNTGTLL